MVNCAILNCKSNTATSCRDNADISFHRFPKDPVTRRKWIEATGRDPDEWVPTENNRICSNHFDESCFSKIADKNKRLIKTETTIPTINILMSVNKGQSIDLGDCSSAESESDKDLILIDDKNTPRKRKYEEVEHDNNPPSTSREDALDSSPSSITLKTEKILLRKLNIANEKIKRKDKEIKRLREQVRRRSKKIQILVDLLTSLKKAVMDIDTDEEDE